tara:strand:+ start:42 stop:3140 length:3099 start_codon:yes stop_codon:yes gene_type:complete
MANKVIAIKVNLQGTDAQKKKLAQLEAEVKKLTLRRAELNKALRNGTISLNEYGRQIARVNTSLTAHRRELLTTRQQMLGVDSFTTKLGKSFRKLGTSIVAGFAGLFAVSQAVQIFRNAINTIREFEQQMAKVKAISGASDSQFKALTKSAKDLGSSTQFTATQVGQLQEEFSKLGLTTPEILKVTKATLDLALASGSELSESALVSASTMRTFGLEAGEMGRIVDVMALSFSSSGLDLEKFKESMKLVGPIAKTTGTSLEETTGALSVLADRTIYGSLAGTQLRKIMSDLATKTGKDFQTSLKITQERLSKAIDPTEKLAIAKELVGDKAKGSLIALAENREEIVRLTESYQNAEGTAQKMADIMGDTLDGDIKRLTSAWEGLILSGTESETVFRSIIQSLTDGVKFIQRNAEAIKTLIKTLIQATIIYKAFKIGANVTRIFQASRKAIISASVAIKAFGKTSKTASFGMKALNVAMKANPIGLLISGLTMILPLLWGFGDATSNASDEVEELNNELESNLGDMQNRYESRNSLSQKALQQLINEYQTELDFIEKRNTSWNASQRAQNKIHAEKEKQEQEKLATLDKRIEAEIEAGKESAEQIKFNFEFERETILKAIHHHRVKQKAIKETSAETEEYSKRIAELTALLKENNKASTEEVGLLERNANALKELREEQKKATTFDDLKRIGKKIKLLQEEGNALRSNIDITKDLQELEDEDNDDFELQNVKEGTNALLDMYDTLNKQSQESHAKFEEDAEARVEGESNAMIKRLDNELAFEQELSRQKIALAEQTASALLQVANDRFNRQKTLELANLDARLEQGLISQADFEKEREAIERKAFERNKRIQLGQIAISLASEIANINMNAAANPTNAFTFGGAGLSQAAVLTGLAVARSAVQAGIVASQTFADGGYTGSGFGSPDSSGFKQAGVVHEGEYVVPKNVLESQRGSSLVSALESMRTNRPQPFSGFGFANGGFAGASGVDITGLRNEISQAVASSIGSIQVVNNATDTITQAAKVNNIQSEATFG